MWTRNFLNFGKKKLRIQKYPDTCGRSVFKPCANFIEHNFHAARVSYLRCLIVEEHNATDKMPRTTPIYIGNTPFPSYLKPLFQSKAWCTTIHQENEFNSHVNEISFSYVRMNTKTRFEKEAKGNSEMTYLRVAFCLCFKTSLDTKSFL